MIGQEHHDEEIDTSQPTVSEAVSVALAELVGEAQEGLLALAVGTGLVGTGLQLLTALMEEDVSEGVSAPVTGMTIRESPRTGLANEARNRSRLKYARPVSEVESGD